MQVDPERLPEECRAFLPLLAQHLDGKLKGPKLDRTLAHLEVVRAVPGVARRHGGGEAAVPRAAPPTARRAGRGGPRGDRGRARPRRLLARRRRPRERCCAGPTGRRPCSRPWCVAALCVGGGLGAATLLVDRGQPEAAPAAPTGEPTAVTGTATVPGADGIHEDDEGVGGQADGEGDARADDDHDSRSPPGRPRPSRPSPRRRPRPEPTTAPEPATEPEPATKPAPTRTTPPPAPRDRTAPTVSITGGPPAQTAEPARELAFSASEAGATFACRLDDGAWQACTSPARHGRAPARAARPRRPRARTAPGTRAPRRRAPGRSCRRPTRRRRP